MLWNKVFATSAPKLLVSDVFSSFTYTGNGSTLAISNGIDLAGEGGLTWIKGRGATTEHQLFDTGRGATNVLVSSSTSDQVLDADTLTLFNSDGFSLGADTKVNDSAANYASWSFRKAPKFFDVVSYIGNGSLSTQLAHDLTLPPALIIAKRHTGGVREWGANYLVGNIGSGGVIGYNLNSDLALRDTGNSITGRFTTDIFSPGYLASGQSSVFNFNSSGDGFVAYLFPNDTSSEGLVRVGNFTTDASGNASVSLGWQPQFLLVKASSVVGDWIILDDQRGWASGGDAAIFPNLNLAETSAVDYGAATATGFSFAGGAASATYIYLAIRKP